MAVLIMVAGVAVMVWAGVEIFKCCRRRQRVRLEIQLEDNFAMVDRRLQAQRAERKTAARARAADHAELKRNMLTLQEQQ